MGRGSFTTIKIGLCAVLLLLARTEGQALSELDQVTWPCGLLQLSRPPDSHIREFDMLPELHCNLRQLTNCRTFEMLLLHVTLIKNCECHRAELLKSDNEAHFNI